MTTSTAVTNARILKIAAAAGVTDLRTDGPGRYFTGSGSDSAIIIKRGKSWRVYSPISSGVAPSTLGTALAVAARLVAEAAEMTARAKALTDAEIAQTLANRDGVEYHYLQRVIAERCHRERVAA